MIRALLTEFKFFRWKTDNLQGMEEILFLSFPCTRLERHKKCFLVSKMRMLPVFMTQHCEHPFLRRASPVVGLMDRTGSLDVGESNHMINLTGLP